MAAFEKGLLQFLYDISDEERQLHRDRMLSAGKDDIIKCAKEYLMTPVEKGLTSKVIVGTEEIEKEEMRKMGWMIAKPIDALASG